MNALNMVQRAVANVVRNRKIESILKFRNPIQLQHFRGGVLLGTYHAFNDITNEGKNLLFDIMFNNGSQIANNSWFIGLISNSSYTALANTDIMSSHTGWTEGTGYSQANRVAWGSGAASGQAVTNATAATFDMTGTDTIKGVFITSNSTKSGTSGKLWATALFGADVPVNNGDQIKVTYTVSA